MRFKSTSVDPIQHSIPARYDAIQHSIPRYPPQMASATSIKWAEVISSHERGSAVPSVAVTRQLGRPNAQSARHRPQASVKFNTLVQETPHLC